MNSDKYKEQATTQSPILEPNQRKFMFYIVTVLSKSHMRHYILINWSKCKQPLKNNFDASFENILILHAIAHFIKTFFVLYFDP